MKAKQSFRMYAHDVWVMAQQERKQIGLEEVPFETYLQKNKEWLTKEWESERQTDAFR